MPSLFLHAGDPLWVPGDLDDLLRALDELGLIAAGPATGENCYAAGSRFLRLVTFLGCSPQVTLDPDQAGDGQAACFLRPHLYPEVRFISGAQPARVRCPRCRSPFAETGAAIHDTLFTCGDCGETLPVSAFDWRQSAGFGRCFLEIGGIYPHEAVPSDKLLDRLQAFSGSDWRHFYAG